MKKVYIGSVNPVKIDSTRLAFQAVFADTEFRFQGEEVPSDVPRQPFSDPETYQGAMNRALNLKRSFPQADYWVGIEGGLEIIRNEMHAFAWMVVMNEHKSGEARTATFMLPGRIKTLIQRGMELGEADDKVFNRRNSKQKDGSVGILTHGVIDRTQYYKPAIILALIPFLNPDLF